MECKFCGAQIGTGSKFCPSCGKNIDSPVPMQSTGAYTGAAGTPQMQGSAGMTGMPPIYGGTPGQPIPSIDKKEFLRQAPFRKWKIWFYIFSGILYVQPIVKIAILYAYLTVSNAFSGWISQTSYAGGSGKAYSIWDKFFFLIAALIVIWLIVDVVFIIVYQVTGSRAMGVIAIIASVLGSWQISVDLIYLFFDLFVLIGAVGSCVMAFKLQNAWNERAHLTIQQR